MSFNEFDEYETSEKVRDWLRRNVASIVGGIALGIGGLWGWHAWQGSQAAQRERAEAAYRALAEALAPGAAPEIAAEAEARSRRLREEFGSTPFATLGALLEARRAVEQGDLPEADRLLARALERSGDAALRSLVRLRLAELRLAEDKPDAALALADAVSGAQWRALREELRGDALARLGRHDEARRAYEDALAALDEGSQARTFIEMKQNDLATGGPVATTTPEAPAAPAGEQKAAGAEQKS
jgi:predicted negative regulator of RcsB-dependent stress response